MWSRMGLQGVAGEEMGRPRQSAQTSSTSRREALDIQARWSQIRAKGAWASLGSEQPLVMSPATTEDDALMCTTTS